MRMPALLLPVLALTACGPAEVREEQSGSAGPPAAMTEVQRNVLALPERLQAGVFMRAIRDGGAPCQQVVQAQRQPDQEGSPLFAVRCDDGPQYAILIDAEGTARVTRLNPSAG